jgi:tetratricopeptide (TPR) repeat protein
MQQLNQALQAGYAALQRGDVQTARKLLRPHKHAKALHLLALVEKAAGELGAADVLLRKASKADPHDPEIANNRGVLAMQLGKPAAAEKAFRRALDLQPTFVQAGTGLGRLLLDAHRWSDAADVYESLLAAAPEDVALRYGYATTQLELGAAETAEAMFDALIRGGDNLPEIRFMRARARLELGRIDEALLDLSTAYETGPSDVCLRTYAGALWMTDQQHDFRSLLENAAQNKELVVTAADLYRQSGDPARAVEVLRDAHTQSEIAVESWAVEATAWIDLNDGASAESAAQHGLATAPDNRLITGSLITALLMQGKADEALRATLPMREKEPHDQHWIACELTALRLQGSPRYEQLLDLDRFVRPYTLPIPAGFDDLQAFNTAFLAALDRWHLYKTHPLEQSLRGGSQTPRDLTAIDDPVIQAFIDALDAPIRQYMDDIGTDKHHPLTARKTGRYRITGSWSVKLQGNGWHVNHVHPEGWISSSYYVSIPEETRSGDDKAGWIKFGEPPFETVPPTPPQKWIRPEAGLLVLFPSFLWHGTAPIHGDSVRVTAPFDAVPD